MAEVEFEPAEDELLEEDMDAEEVPADTEATPGAKKKKGRGFKEAGNNEGRYGGTGTFEALDSTGGPGPQKCM